MNNNKKLSLTIIMKKKNYMKQKKLITEIPKKKKYKGERRYQTSSGGDERVWRQRWLAEELGAAAEMQG